jgi:predicted transcriptional regulator
VSATTILRKQDLIPSQPHRVKNRTSDGQKKFSRRLISGAAFSLLLASFSINAATVPEYQKNVRTARELTIELRDYLDASENLDQIDAAYEKSRLAEIRRALPVSEKIEWQEATIETGNEWINAELTVYAGENNLPKRIEVLTAIGERLAALEEKLAELENPNISNRTKDEDKQKLAEILRREEYQKPEQKQESLVQKWWQQLLDWFADAFPKPKISENAASGAQSVSFVLQIILYAIVLGVIGFLIYRFAPIFLQNRRAREKSEKKERVILGERVAANDSAATLFGEAEAAGTCRRFALGDSQRLHRAFVRFKRPPRYRFGSAQNQPRLPARRAPESGALRKYQRIDRQFRTTLVRFAKRCRRRLERIS